MAGTATTATEFCTVLSRSKLIPEADVRAQHQRWQKETKAADTDVDLFRKYLITKKFLTEYQAALIQRGYTDGFFIGGYVILDRIGKGQSAVVYKAVHNSGQVVALKVLPGSKSRDANTLNRFQREGRLLTQLEHPNVVRGFQIGQGSGVWFLVMEYLEGETLQDVLTRRKKLPPPEAVRLISQALSGLQHLADKRMIHRDLKPANLMILPAGTPGPLDSTLQATLKILDIGIGREQFDDEAPDTQDLHLTVEGSVLGTPDYLAPEQARDARAADIRADIYSLGCVLFHLIAGRPPFDDKNMLGQMVKHATEKIAPLATVAANVPIGLQAVFDKLTAKKPDDRYVTPLEAVKALQPFLPSDGADVAASAILPAYQAWLETESSIEFPVEPKKPPGTATDPIIPTALPPLPTRPQSVKPSATGLEVNVELVTDDPERSYLDPSRRDFVMLGTGAFGVLAAIGIGYGLQKLMKRSLDSKDPSPPEPK